MQGLCLISSLLSLSLVTANYHRYESQAKGGRKRVLGNVSPTSSEASSVQGDGLQRVGSLRLPVKVRWTKAMTEDVPVGKLLLFVFWFMFLLGRLLSLGLAASFFPAVVLGICAVHYLIFFLYILPSPKFTASLPTKLFLPFIFVFCLVEVGIQFSKPGILYTLFYLVTVAENLGLTVVWVLWGDWRRGYWYFYSIYLIGITHMLALFFVALYIKFYRPKVKRMRPRSMDMPEEHPIYQPVSTDIY